MGKPLNIFFLPIPSYGGYCKFLMVEIFVKTKINTGMFICYVY